MTIIAIANQKGGCGKTTTAINLAACLGRKNKRVLLIDMDPQGHASLGLGQHCQDVPGLYEVFMTEVQLEDVIINKVTDNVDLAPATISLAAVEHLLADIPHRERQLAIQLEHIKNHYDFIIIDCPPTLSLLSFNALRAANRVLIPVELSTFALDGIDRLLETIDLLSTRYDLDIPVHIVATQVDYRTRFSHMIFNDLQSRFPDKLLATLINFTIRLKEAAYHGKPIIDHAPASPAAHNYTRLADEILLETGTNLSHLSSMHTLSKKHHVEQDKPFTAEQISPQHETSEPSSQALISVTLKYKYSPENDIKIAGDFNNWAPDQGVINQVINNILYKTLNLAPDIYQYRLVINGKWQEDSNNDLQVINNFGETNSMLKVEPELETA